jgi:uncharacterized protein (TIGR02145 family)
MTKSYRKFLIENDEDENCDVGGRLYNWTAAVDSVTLAKNIDFR